jgi:uncharacterized protein (DUF2461 family)
MNMETTNLIALIKEFYSLQTTDSFITEQSQSHVRRKKNVQNYLQIQKIPELSRDQITDLLKDTDAYFGVRGQQQFWKKLFGEHDENLEKLKANLSDLLKRAEVGLTAQDVKEILAVLPGIGPAFLSEILALRFPGKYWLLNGPIRSFLKSQNVDLNKELPQGKKGDQGLEYFLAGEHLKNLRSAMSSVAGKNADFLAVDLFAYWVIQSKRSVSGDPWKQQVNEYLSLHAPAERIHARKLGEAKARALLSQKAGQFDEQDLRAFLGALSADFANNIEKVDRFMPAFYGHQVILMLKNLPAFNEWSKTIWTVKDENLDTVLTEFWAKAEVGGAGVSLPTAILYLREPEKYTIWLPIMSRGLENAAAYQPGEWRQAASYRYYNQAALNFRKKYDIPSEALDIILAGFGREKKEAGSGKIASSFSGFVEDTFTFLSDLVNNNSDQWMHQDNDANQLRYQNVLREPLRQLFQSMAPRVAKLDPDLETEVKFGKVLATIKKRWPDKEGPYYPYLWGAFYHRSRTKQTDAQLFANVHPDRAEIGFSLAASQGANIVELFRKNLQQYSDVFLHLLQSLPEPYLFTYWEGEKKIEKLSSDIQAVKDLEPVLQADEVEVKKRFMAEDPVLFHPEFADLAIQVIEQTYPFFVFATSNDPETIKSLEKSVGEADITEIDVADHYTLEKLSAQIYMPQPFCQEVLDLIHNKGQIIFYGPPGTGKTFIAREFARYICDNAKDPTGEWRIVQFHPSYSYEEFIEGIRPESDEANHMIRYPIKDGIFKLICKEARNNQKRKYVLIIDEINRGELARILGELLLCLEYRDQVVQLPYSKESFMIPDNVFIIGTMNTADRSIALVDHALRRRFHFVPLKPSSDVLKQWLTKKGEGEMDWIARLLDTLNQQLDQDGVDWPLHIGHSHFMQEDITEEQLNRIWKYDILPMLEEYFYRDKTRLMNYDLAKLKAETDY